MLYIPAVHKVVYLRLRAVFDKMSGGENVSSNDCVQDEYDSGPYLWIAGIRIGTGLVSFLCCLLLVSFFVYTKKHLIVTNQILVFFLALSTMIHSFSYLISRVNFNTRRSIIDKYCLFAGSLELYTGWTEWMSILCISYNLLVQVIYQPKPRKKVHRIYFSLIFILPLLWCWLPFINLSYGSVGPWCGIRIFTEHCNDFLYGLILRILFIEIPLLILLLVTIIFSIITWIIMKHKLYNQRTKLPYPPQSLPVDKDEVLRELKILLWCPPIYSILQLFLLINLAYDCIEPTSPLLILWFLQVFTSPLAGAIIVIVIVLNIETNFRARLRLWCVRHVTGLTASSEPAGSPRLSSTSKPHVNEYDCDLNISYGDSLEGVRDKHRRDRVKSSSQPLSTVDE